MTPQERNKRRAMIVRRWAAYRVSRAQREIWRERRARAGRTADEDDETSNAADDELLAELPDGLVG